MATWRVRRAAWLPARIAALALTLVSPMLAWAQVTLQNITSAQQAGADVVRIELSQPLSAVPSGFVVQAPPRVALDLPPLINAMGRNVVDVNQGNLRSVAVAQSGDRTRLVLNLRQPGNYRAELQDNALLIFIEGGAPLAAAAVPPAAVVPAGVTASAAPAAAPRTVFAPSQNLDALPVRDIDFRRGPDGAGRMVVTLASTQVGVDIRQQGQGLAVDLLRSSLPSSLRRRLDVTDFGTPVQFISASQQGDTVRLLVDARGNWEHSAYQSDNQFVLEVKPIKVDPNKMVAGKPGYSGEKLSLNFQNIEVRALLQVIADFTNFNVVTSDTVTGSVTLRLKDVPWDQALDIILQSKGLGVRKNGNVLWVAPKEELAAKEQLELEAKKKLAELEPLRTQSFQLNYTKAEEVARSLVGQIGSGSGVTSASAGGSVGLQSQRILSPRGSLMYESRTNQLFVSDIPSKLEEVAQMIAKIDIPVRQVLIEARIVEADDKFGRNLGVKLGGVDTRGLQGGVPGVSIGGGNYVQIGSNYTNAGKQLGLVSGALDWAATQMVNLPAAAISGNPAATLALSLFSPSANRVLNLELSALEADGKGKVLSSPRIITTDQKKAVIEQGEQIPYQQATSSGATSIQFKNASLKLEVTPQITPEGAVIMDVEVSKDSRGDNTISGPAINTKRAQTQVLVENGGTVVIGGIFTQEDRLDVNKVPLLGDVPVVGALFRNTAKVQNKTELLIFITPKIVNEKTQLR